MADFGAEEKIFDLVDREIDEPRFVGNEFHDGTRSSVSADDLNFYAVDVYIGHFDFGRIAEINTHIQLLADFHHVRVEQYDIFDRDACGKRGIIDGNRLFLHSVPVVEVVTVLHFYRVERTRFKSACGISVAHRKLFDFRIAFKQDYFVQRQYAVLVGNIEAESHVGACRGDIFYAYYRHGFCNGVERYHGFSVSGFTVQFVSEFEFYLVCDARQQSCKRRLVRALQYGKFSVLGVKQFYCGKNTGVDAPLVSKIDIILACSNRSHTEGFPRRKRALRKPMCDFTVAIKPVESRNNTVTVGCVHHEILECYIIHSG